MSARHEAWVWMPRRIYSSATTIPPKIEWGLAYIVNGVIRGWLM